MCIRDRAELASRNDVRVHVGNHHRVMVFGRDEASLREKVGSLMPVRGTARPGATFVACPGRRWCSRALTDTNDLADLLRDELAGQLPPETTVCVSGCPNGCAHSAVADVGLTGALTRDNGQTRQVWNLFFGGVTAGRPDWPSRSVSASRPTRSCGKSDGASRHEPGPAKANYPIA